MITQRCSTLLTTLFLILSISPNVIAHEATKSKFPSCSSQAEASPIAAPQTCSQADDPVPLGELRAEGQRISTSLQRTMDELRDGHQLNQKVEAAVSRQLDISIEKYGRLAKCDASCSDELAPMLSKLGRQIRAMRTELALMQPDAVDPQGINRTENWYSLKPRQPFAKSPPLQMLSFDERKAMRETFIQRLGKFVPTVGARAEDILEKKEVISQTATETTYVTSGMIQVQGEARENYLKLISDNPLLIFLSDTNVPPKAQDVAKAATLMHEQITAEKNRLNQIKDPRKKFEALIEYNAAVDSVLKTDTKLCRVADAVSDSADTARSRRTMVLLTGQVAAGFAAFALCSGVVTCGLAAGVISAADYGLARDDAKEAFRAGVAKASRPDEGRERFAKDAMTTADSAAKFQYATLALAAPTVVKSGAEAVRASTTAIKAALKGSSSEAVSTSGKGRLLNEIVGAPETSKLSAMAQKYYKDVLDPYTGRERQVIETLIERMRAKGIEPAKISSTLKDRIRQCVF